MRLSLAHVITILVLLTIGLSVVIRTVDYFQGIDDPFMAHEWREALSATAIVVTSLFQFVSDLGTCLYRWTIVLFPFAADLMNSIVIPMSRKYIIPGFYRMYVNCNLMGKLLIAWSTIGYAVIKLLFGRRSHGFVNHVAIPLVLFLWESVLPEWVIRPLFVLIGLVLPHALALFIVNKKNARFHRLTSCLCTSVVFMTLGENLSRAFLYRSHLREILAGQLVFALLFDTLDPIMAKGQRLVFQWALRGTKSDVGASTDLVKVDLSLTRHIRPAMSKLWQLVRSNQMTALPIAIAVIIFCHLLLSLLGRVFSILVNVIVLIDLWRARRTSNAQILRLRLFVYLSLFAWDAATQVSQVIFEPIPVVGSTILPILKFLRLVVYSGASAIAQYAINWFDRKRKLA